ncbi:MAG TPA: cytochrome c biogenesis protein CcdA [Candidatus Paceibacterota bacterium]
MDLSVETLAIPSFIAGILTFLAPCTLPLVPGYLAFISGVSLGDLKIEENKKLKWKIFLNGLAFVIGFSIVFIFLGALVGFGGRHLIQYRDILARVGGVFVIFFGLFMLNIFKIPFLNKDFKPKTPKIFEKGRPLNSIILGSTFALGWTPCVGPILGSVLTLAGASATVGSGVALLSIFSLGLAIPFLLIALLINSSTTIINSISKYLNIISFVGGAFLIFLGVLIVMGQLGVWIGYFYEFFDFINYEKLLNFL